MFLPPSYTLGYISRQLRYRRLQCPWVFEHVKKNFSSLRPIPVHPNALTSPTSSETNKTVRSQQSLFDRTSFLIPLKQRIRLWTQLSKGKLTLWVGCSAVSGFFLMGGVDVSILLGCFGGTLLCSAAANTGNQLIEIKRDQLMNRTKNRPLPSNRCTKLEASAFGLTAASAGILTLLYFTNPLTACLGGLNIVLYTAVYTPLKVRTPYNTHIGAIVGAIPPLMGCTAAGSNLLLCGQPWLLFLLQLLWQFPHFYSLAWLHRKDYLRAGYVMFPLSDVTGKGTAKMCKPYLLATALLPTASSLLGFTTCMFMIDSLVPNIILYYYFQKFQKNPSQTTNRTFFAHQLWHLLVMMGLLVYHSIPLQKKMLSDEFDHSSHDLFFALREILTEKCIHKAMTNLHSYCCLNLSSLIQRQIPPNTSSDLTAASPKNLKEL